MVRSSSQTMLAGWVPWTIEQKTHPSDMCKLALQVGNELTALIGR